MRSDMDKVIVERPRYGSRSPSRKKGYKRYINSVPLEDQPQRESMLGRWKGRDKLLNEHLGPMRRFLRSNIGRPWNKVHQELCEYVSFDNAVQAHVLAHVFEYVHLHVEVQDRSTVFDLRPFWRSLKLLRANDMYVCPRTGILKAVLPNHHQPPIRRIVLDRSTQYHLRENRWWKVCVRGAKSCEERSWDAWLERLVSELPPETRMEAYGENLIAISKRPATHEEAKWIQSRVRKRN